MIIRTFTESDRRAVIELWKACDLTRPWNDPDLDITRKLAVQPELFLVGELAGQVIASVMGGYDGHRGSVFYLAVSPDHQGQGYGKLLMAKIEELLVAMGCPKLNIVVRATNKKVLNFYDKAGYGTDDVISLGKRLILDIELQPTLTGDTIHLRPLTPEDFDALYLAASDPQIWSLHPDYERYRRDVFQKRYFEGALASGSALVIEENGTGRVIGSSRYYDWDPTKKEICIGYTFIERSHWGKGTNTELKDLMLGHIYRWADAVWFHVAKTNLRSCRALEKLGAKLVREEPLELEGRPFVQLHYKLDCS